MSYPSFAYMPRSSENTSVKSMRYATYSSFHCRHHARHHVFGASKRRTSPNFPDTTCRATALSTTTWHYEEGYLWIAGRIDDMPNWPGNLQNNHYRMTFLLTDLRWVNIDFKCSNCLLWLYWASKQNGIQEK